jgi:hypothetical protein
MHGTRRSPSAQNALLQQALRRPTTLAFMSFRVWIVCLMLALLPLRGWAAASMTVPAAGHDATSEVAQVAGPAQPMAPSCHEAAGDDSTPAGHACNLCDLCHGAAADQAEARVAQMPLPDVTPPVAVARDTGRHAVGGLDRPPRIHLA